MEGNEKNKHAHEHPKFEIPSALEEHSTFFTFQPASFFSVYPRIQEEVPCHFGHKLPSSFSLAVQSIQQEFLRINLSSPWKLELY